MVKVAYLLIQIKVSNPSMLLIVLFVKLIDDYTTTTPSGSCLPGVWGYPYETVSIATTKRPISIDPQKI